MAFITQPSKIKQSILAFIKHMVSKSVLKAIDYILSPCCEDGNITVTVSNLTIDGVSVDNKKIKIVVLVEDPVATSGFAVGTTNGSGDVVIS